MNVNTNVNKREASNWVKKYSRFGMAAKGVVYILIGVLSALAAFNAGGGKATGKDGVFQFLQSQPFGNVLLGIVALGLLGYVVWRGVQTFLDPEDEGMSRRLGYASSGIFYLLIAITAITMIFGGSGGSGGSGGNEKIAQKLMQNSWGQIAVGILALVLFGKAFWQFYRALSGKLDNKIKNSKLNNKVQKTVKNAGRIGYISRGIVISIIGVLFMKAALQANPSQAGGTKEAFSFLQQSVAGPIIFGVVAIGLAAYGVFMLVKARYRVMPSL